MIEEKIKYLIQKYRDEIDVNLYHVKNSIGIDKNSLLWTNAKLLLIIQDLEEILEE